MKLLQIPALGLLIVRLAPGARSRPLVKNRSGKDANTKTPPVQVVIPARDEEHRIASCLQALRAHEVMVVDDNSTDDTARVAESFGVNVVTAPPLPRGWVGKQHALQVGLESATAEWVLFLDADTRIKPGFIEAAVQRAIDDQLNIASFSARFMTHSILQQALHMSFLSTLVYRFGPVASPTEKSPLINGQALLVRRVWFLAQGGFTVAPSNMTDDIALAKKLTARGVKIGFVDGSDLIDVDMFATASETWTQWGRSLAMTDVLSLRSRIAQAALLFLTQVLPLFNIARRKSSGIDYALLAIRYALLIPFRKTVTRPGIGLVLSPMLDGISLVRLISASLRPNSKWRGRSYLPSQTADR